MPLKARVYFVHPCPRTVHMTQFSSSPPLHPAPNLRPCGGNAYNSACAQRCCIGRVHWVTTCTYVELIHPHASAKYAQEAVQTRLCMRRMRKVMYTRAFRLTVWHWSLQRYACMNSLEWLLQFLSLCLRQRFNEKLHNVQQGPNVQNHYHVVITAKRGKYLYAPYDFHTFWKSVWFFSATLEFLNCYADNIYMFL